MRLLLVKTSSLGDVIHALPAVTDAQRACPQIALDWLVEEDYCALPRRHPAVQRVIPVALRRWRRTPLRAILRGEVGAFIRTLRAQPYDFVIDAQGLIKSGVLSTLAHGRRVGYDRLSAREPLASYCYHHRLPVASDQHAIERIRRLFSRTLNYPYPNTPPDYGLPPGSTARTPPFLLLLHGAAWPSKVWPEAHWVRLAQLATSAGYQLRLPWGSEQELRRAKRIIAAAGCGVLLSPMSIADLADEISQASGVVGGDSGLVHLAAALEVPCIALYGPTDPYLTGVRGRYCHTLSDPLDCSPCLSRHCRHPAVEKELPPCLLRIDPQQVWQRLANTMQEKAGY